MMVSMDVKAEIAKRAALVEPVLLSYAESNYPQIGEMLSHPIRAGGKRIRPAVVLLACEAVGGNPKRILSAAASVELLHTFTLVHDDIMDADSERRGKPTVHAIWGEGMGIVVGDTLYAKAFKSLSDVRKKGVDAGRVLDAIDALNWANEEVHEGQMLDMSFEKRDGVTEAEYITMIEKKTAALLEGSLKIGCILGGGDRSELKALSSYGRNVGVAFQIQDDLLDLTADESKLGKPVGSDIRQGKKSLIVIHALQNLPKAHASRLSSMLGSKSMDDKKLAEAIALIQESDSIDYSKERVEKMSAEAKKSLMKLPPSKSRDVLAALADYLIRRDY
jgi:geranylgeranyl diphosphate synthase type I